MRIGILTFQRAHNYGAILQCFALQEKLIELGYDVEVIDYCPPSMDFYKYFKWSRFRPWHPRSSFINLLSIPRRKKRYDAFNDFIESHLKLSSPDTIESLSEKYDLVIVGSDQVWNPQNSMGQYDEYYWGKFKNGDKPKLITYAVSMGGAWKHADWNKIKTLLANFDALSVREKILCDIIKENCERKVAWALDPTLLQTRDFWKSKVQHTEEVEPYLFFYQARFNEKAIAYAKDIACKMNLKLVCLSADVMRYNTDKMIAVGPIGFLNYINNASFVLTSSFHGTVFCYQFMKRFSTLALQDGDDGRAESFLSSVGLEKHMVSLSEQPNVFEPNWKNADIVLNQKRLESIDWLISNIR